ncbi:MAG: cytochrome b/b6 domain-containing protein [Steroidobacteraceae bacterium]|nr:cytochrome b/b6 domain-containing protein [Nevskiaceae bacterium]MCP5359527.1 cytochrome b/b6 domain-containing protein [Nevskiaceae bacterium]MCP5467475.1 cytochrome b/b6 domain-containing protein [Nevskiaceae bacterium]
MSTSSSDTGTKAAAPTAPARALVWDLPVRLMHWILVLAVAGAWMTQQLEGDWFKYHVWCGYTVLIVVVTRLVWGFVGTRHARFGSFLRGPAAVFGYARGLVGRGGGHHAGHNPLGALMVVVLLLLLLAMAVTGLFANDEIMSSGPLYGYVLGSTSNRLTSIHRQIFDFLLVAIALHVIAAFFYLLVRRDNLILPMITGRKPADAVPPEERIASSRTWLWALIVAACAIGLYQLVRTAPKASLFSF